MAITWPGQLNGRIALHLMERVRGEYFHPEAARQLRALEAAFARQFGYEFIINEGYRSLATQNRYWYGWVNRLPGYNLAARPGFSNHGWGKAGDFGSGINVYGSAQKKWMDANAPLYGWKPTGNSFSPREAWHYDYVGSPAILAGSNPVPITLPIEEDEEMRLVQIHAVEKGKWRRALLVPGTAYFMEWSEGADGSGSTVANSFGQGTFDTGNSQNVVTFSVFDALQAAAKRLEPKPCTHEAPAKK